MERDIIRDIIFLQRKSEPACAGCAEDMAAARDLYDTLAAHQDHCAGLAANMIGVSKRILAVVSGDKIIVMLNPKINKKSGRTYTTKEGCLSLSGTRPTERAEEVEVTWTDMDSRKKRKRFRGLTAEAIQHEMDHFDGILI